MNISNLAFEAVSLLSEEGENLQYDRALAEIVTFMGGGTSDDVQMIFVALKDCKSGLFPQEKLVEIVDINGRMAEDEETNMLVLDALGMAIAHGPKDAISDLEKLHDRVSGKTSAKWKAGDRFVGGASNEEHIIYYDYVGTEERKTFGVVRLSDGFHMASRGQEYENADAFMERHWGLNCKKVEKPS